MKESNVHARVQTKIEKGKRFEVSTLNHPTKTFFKSDTDNVHTINDNFKKKIKNFSIVHLAGLCGLLFCPK
jgi:hypothetical protein